MTTRAMLALDPVWDPIRADPGIQGARGRRREAMTSFFERLRQRKIVQWALAYIAAAFALIQVADIVGQRFGWPEQAMRIFIVVTAVGFFVTLIVAWYHGERGVQRVNGTELLILALVLAIGGAVAWKLGPPSAPKAACRDGCAAAIGGRAAAAQRKRRSAAGLFFRRLVRRTDLLAGAGAQSEGDRPQFVVPFPRQGSGRHRRDRRETRRRDTACKAQCASRAIRCASSPR